MASKHRTLRTSVRICSKNRKRNVSKDTHGKCTLQMITSKSASNVQRDTHRIIHPFGLFRFLSDCDTAEDFERTGRRTSLRNYQELRGITTMRESGVYLLSFRSNNPPVHWYKCVSRDFLAEIKLCEDSKCVPLIPTSDIFQCEPYDVVKTRSRRIRYAYAACAICCLHWWSNDCFQSDKISPLPRTQHFLNNAVSKYKIFLC